jgi:sterol desaturase/sphingolipid hydroxylase (fatty acid hydroxylase superfamily)
MLEEKLTLTYAVLLTLNALGILGSYWLVLAPPVRLKIQERGYDLATLNGRMPLILLNLGALYASAFVGLTLADDLVVMASIPWWSLVLQLFVVSLVDDTYFYFFHRWMHRSKTVYARIHRIHHKAYTPVPMEYIYVHPLEWIMGSAAPVAGFLVVALPFGVLNFWVFLAYAALRNLHELDIHSGLRTTVQRWIPGLAVTEHHDLHHARPQCGNYGSMYLLWDRLLGTRVES